MHRLVTSAAAAAAAVLLGASARADAQTARDIVGTWTLVSAVAQQGGAGTDPRRGGAIDDDPVVINFQPPR